VLAGADHPAATDIGVPPNETTATSQARDAALHPFAFDVVTLDESGRGTARRRGSAQQVVEDLGNGVALEMVHIPGGTFVMGAPEHEADSPDEERPQHRVTVPLFYLGKYAVTIEQWVAVTGASPDGMKIVDETFTASRRQPVVRVSYDEAEAFCSRLAQTAGRAYRLPTEAEWEYACRAGTTTALHIGDVVDSYAANFNGLSPYGAGRGGPFHRTTVRVGEYPANKFGLFDMHGNVMEWCSDWYAADYYKDSPKEDPRGPEAGTDKATRGGSWSNSGKACRSAVRTKLAPGSSHYGLGFRVVLVQGK
jgi:formylglycine-generating enzyme required for sulfatase activity